MSLVVPGSGVSFSYAGSPVSVLAGADGQVDFASAEMTVPPRFQGPIPHVHDTFDEAIYVVTGRLLAGTGTDEPGEAATGAMLVAPRGVRHFFSNPFDEPARVLGIWSPARIGLEFMKAVGAALPASGPPDPNLMREIYEAHGSRLQP